MVGALYASRLKSYLPKCCVEILWTVSGLVIAHPTRDWSCVCTVESGRTTQMHRRVGLEALHFLNCCNHIRPLSICSCCYHLPSILWQRLRPV